MALGAPRSGRQTALGLAPHGEAIQPLIAISPCRTPTPGRLERQCVPGELAREEQQAGGGLHMALAQADHTRAPAAVAQLHDRVYLHAEVVAAVDHLVIERVRWLRAPAQSTRR